MSETEIIVGARSVYHCDVSVQPINRQRPQAAQTVNSSGLSLVV